MGSPTFAGGRSRTASTSSSTSPSTPRECSPACTACSIAEAIPRRAAGKRSAILTRHIGPSHVPHALIVEDDADSAEMLAEIVAAEGFSTATAGSLLDARRQLAFRKPDI